MCAQLAEEYFGEDTTDKFLRQYILNKGWVDKTEAANYVPSYGEVGILIYFPFHNIIDIYAATFLFPS